LQAFSCVLSEREDEAWLTLPVDMPGLRRSTLQSLLRHWRQAESQALVAEGDDRLQPLFGVYPCGAHNRCALDQELAQGRGRWFGWLERIPYSTFLCPERDLINVNRPDDLAALMR
jgi:molybdopterin-guanine dinucleotide biosynthesis protein A